MKIFSWKTNFFKDADAQLVGEELEQIEQLGKIEPSEVI